MASILQSGSLIGPVGRNRYGWQIFQFLDPEDGQWRYVVHLPDGRLLYSDSAGDIGHGVTGFGAQGAGAVLGGAGGFLALGPIGLLIGSILGPSWVINWSTDKDSDFCRKFGDARSTGRMGPVSSSTL